MADATAEISSLLRGAREKAAAARPAPLLDSESRRTLERLRDRLMDDEREGFLYFDGPAHAKSEIARQTREQIAALNRALAALGCFA